MSNQIIISADDLPAERGWPPFLEWCRENGIDPEWLKVITLNSVTLQGYAEFYGLCDHCGCVEFDEDGPRIEEVAFTAKSLPPTMPEGPASVLRGVEFFHEEPEWPDPNCERH
jgi:hypothetical protein